MDEAIINVSDKGRITIPKRLREKYSIKDKALVVEDSENGIIIRPLPSPADGFGCLKQLSPNKTARELVEEGRKEDYEREKRLLRLAGLSEKR